MSVNLTVLYILIKSTDQSECNLPVAFEVLDLFSPKCPKLFCLQSS